MRISPTFSTVSQMKKEVNDFALVTSYGQDTGIHRYDTNLERVMKFGGKYFFRFQKERKGKTMDGWETVNSTFPSSKVAYAFSFHFKSTWLRRIERFKHVHITSTEFFHLAKWHSGLIGTVHDMYVTDPLLDFSNLYKNYFLNDLSYCDELEGVICISNQTRLLFNNYFPKCNCKVIHHWTPIVFQHIDKDLARKKLSLPRNKFILMNVSSNSPNKNNWLLKEIVNSLDDSFLLIKIGQPEIMTYNPKRVINIDQHISDDLLSLYYSASDLYLAPSFSDGFNYPIIESLNSGTPVIGSRIAVFKEVLKNSPFLFDPHNVREWSDIIFSMKDKKAYKEIVEWYANNISDYYTENKGRERMLEYYSSVGINVK